EASARQIAEREEDRYLAPELLLGWSRATSLSDQFGLGVALAFLFDGGLAGRWSLDLQMPRVRGPVGDTIRRLLARRPVDRFGWVEEAAEALAPPSSRRSRPTGRRRPPSLGSEYESWEWIHSGSRSTVEGVLHKPTGTLREFKLGHPEPRAGQALRHEAELLSRLAHARLPRCHATGQTEDGRTWILLDWLPGETLESRLLRGDVPAPDDGR